MDNVVSTEPKSLGKLQKTLSPGRILGYSIANLGFGAFYALNNAVLPLWLQGFTQNAVLLGLMGGTHSFEGAIIQPLVGSWSDRLRSRWGRRRPFLLVCIPIAALLMLLAPLAAHLPPAIRLGAIIGSIVLFTVAFNIAFDPYQAWLADITPEEQRGRVAGVWYFVSLLGQVATVLLPLPAAVKFLMVGTVMLVTTLVTCAVTKEPSLNLLPQPDRQHQDGARSALQGLKTLRQARLFLLSFLCYGAGTSVVVPFLTVFIKSITHCTDQQAEGQFAILMIVTAVAQIPFGKVSDKIGPKRLLLLSMALIALAAVNGLWITTLSEVSLVLVLAGLGTAAQNASAYPLLTEIVPAGEIGFYTGLQTAVLSISGPLTVALTGLLINHSQANHGHGSYRLIFAVCAVCVIGAIAILSRLERRDSVAEIAAREEAIS